MKKAKFNDNFKMVAGSCIGHYNIQQKQCQKCGVSKICCKMTEDHITPKNEKEVIKFIGGK